MRIFYMFYGERTFPFSRRMQARKRFGKSFFALSPLRRELLENSLRVLFSRSYEKLSPLSAVAYVTAEPVPFEARESGTKTPVILNQPWAKNVFDCAWIHVTGSVPQGENVVLLLNLGGEGLVVTSDGVEKQSITNFASQFDYSLGLPVKRVVFPDGLTVGGEADFWVDAAANDLFGTTHDNYRVRDLCVAKCNENIRALAYDLQVLLSAYDFAPDSDFSASICKVAKSILANARNLTEENAQALRLTLTPLLERVNDKPAFEYGAVGHAHLDLAWLWPLRESYRKSARTFASQLLNIERYDDYIFGASQAQLYDWVRTMYPRLYERMREKVRENRWELQGATWVEMDSNLVSGESLIRQFRYGKEYFLREFGEDMKILWLPDSFGYSACLPQVMKLANVPYFLTQKMSWNTVTRFPYHTFKWRGLDGTEVFAHMLPESTYNGPCNGERAEFGEHNYSERKISDKSIMLFGIGDGGAGPGFEHLEREKRLADLKGLPKVTPRKALDTMRLLDDGKTNYPTHQGELYLEKHQGTYTTRAANKRDNRRAEFALRNYELLAAMATERGKSLPISMMRLEELWKEILLYQFHDILPGSSINRVYEETAVRYAAILGELDSATNSLLSELFGKGKFNFTGAPVVVRESGRKLVVAPYSFAPESEAVDDTLSAVANGNTLENELVRITFKDGRITSYYLKESGKELVASGGTFGDFVFYADNGDCWDYKRHYARSKRGSAKCVSFKTETEGAVARAVSVFSHGSTSIVETAELASGETALKLSLDVSYHSEHECVRFDFATAVKAARCAFNVQFGHLYRSTTENTPAEKAQFEVSGQKFVDLTGDGLGLSLINDGKYGYRCKGNVISVSLVRSPTYPGKQVDLGKHEINFVLLPHLNPLGKETYDAAYALNNPPRAVDGKGETSGKFCEVSDGNIVVEGVRLNEDSIVLHCYNSSEEEKTAKITMPERRATAEVGVLGDVLSELSDGEITFRPFELKLVKFERA